MENQQLHKLIHEYKLHPYSIKLNKLIAYVDGLLIKTIVSCAKKNAYYLTLDEQEVYNAAVLGFVESMKTYSVDAKPIYLPARIKFYVAAYLKKEFGFLHREKFVRDTHGDIAGQIYEMDTEGILFRVSLRQMVDMNMLTKREYGIIYKTFIDGYNGAEVAALFQLTYPMYRKILASAFKKIKRSMLKDDWYENGK